MNGECTCPGNKEEQTPDYICGCPADMVDDGTGTDNCVAGKCTYFLAKVNFLWSLCIAWNNQNPVVNMYLNQEIKDILKV